jgi:hypothetical protein
MGKWDDFRVARDIAIKKYFEARKKQLRAEKTIRYATCSRLIRWLFIKFRKYTAVKIRGMRVFWSSFLIVQACKRNVKACVGNKATI